MLFVSVKFSRKKKIKEIKITPDSLIHYTTKMYLDFNIIEVF